MLKEQKKTSTFEEPVNPDPTLSDMGIDKKLSNRSQKVADIPEEEYEELISGWRDRLETEKKYKPL